MKLLLILYCVPFYLGTIIYSKLYLYYFLELSKTNSFSLFSDFTAPMDRLTWLLLHISVQVEQDLVPLNVLRNLVFNDFGYTSIKFGLPVLITNIGLSSRNSRSHARKD